MSEGNRENTKPPTLGVLEELTLMYVPNCAENIDDMRNDFHYCDNGSSREVMDAGSSFSARGGDGECQ